MARILVIDDNSSMREVLATCLPEYGHTVVEASDGVDGLKLADPQVVDLVLMDVEMPRMNGISVCETLKGDPARRQMPVLLMTGRPSRDVVQHARKAGAQAVLGKPFTWDELFAEFDRHLPADV